VQLGGSRVRAPGRASLIRARLAGDGDLGGAIAYGAGLAATAILAYAFNALMGRHIPAGQFATFGALLSGLLVLSGPMAALLAGAAMASVRAGRLPAAGWRRGAVVVAAASALGGIVLPGSTNRSVAWFVAACAFSFVGAWNRGVIIGFGRLGLVGATFVFEGVARVGLLGAFLALGFGGVGAAAALALGIGAGAGLTEVLVPRMARGAPVPIRPEVWLSTAGLLFVGLLQFADVAAVRLFGTPGGEYMAASSIARLALFVQIPAAAYALRRAAVASPRAALPRAMALALLPSLGVIAAVEVAPRLALDLTYGGRYVNAAGLVRVLAPAMVLAGMAFVLIHLLMGAGRTVWVWSVAATGSLGLAAVFIAASGTAMGTATVMLLAQLAVLAMAALHALRLVGAGTGDEGAVLFLSWRDTRHPQGGGSEVFVEQIASRLAAEGRRVTIFCAEHDDAPRDEVVNGVRFLRRGGWRSVYGWALVYHLLGRFGPHDVVVDVWNGIPFFSPLYCGRRVVTLVHHVHREQWPLNFSPLRAKVGWWVESRLVPLLYRRATFVTVSASTKEELGELGIPPDSIRVVNNVGPTAESRAGTRSARPTVTYLGRLVPHKRVDVLLEAASRLAAEVPDLRVRIVGRGPLEQELVDRARRAGLDGTVSFEGFVDEATKRDVLASSWVLALPSVKEGWGLAVVEAAAVQTPAVAFRTGGLTESIIDEETGILADEFDGFVAGIRRLLSSPAARSRMGEAAAAHAGRFTWEATMAGFRAALAGAPAVDRVPEERAAIEVA
jgi:glycosyltransferase involved in cell wall biosynthesis